MEHSWVVGRESILIILVEMDCMLGAAIVNSTCNCFNQFVNSFKCTIMGYSLHLMQHISTFVDFSCESKEHDQISFEHFSNVN